MSTTGEVIWDNQITIEGKPIKQTSQGGFEMDLHIITQKTCTGMNLWKDSNINTLLTKLFGGNNELMFDFIGHYKSNDLFLQLYKRLQIGIVFYVK